MAPVGAARCARRPNVCGAAAAAAYRRLLCGTNDYDGFVYLAAVSYIHIECLGHPRDFAYCRAHVFHQRASTPCILGIGFRSSYTGPSCVL